MKFPRRDGPGRRMPLFIVVSRFEWEAFAIQVRHLRLALSHSSPRVRKPVDISSNRAKVSEGGIRFRRTAADELKGGESEHV